MIGVAAVALLATTSVLLFGFGVNLLYLTWRATRAKPERSISPVQDHEPLVCVQLPIYDERYVAERVLDAACGMDWPHDRLEIQVLDDSDDESVSILDRRTAHWRAKGLDVRHVRRHTRSGFKAGALAHGLAATRAPYVAVFDADFVPPRDFLRRTIGAFTDPAIGFVQARWGHIDEDYSTFTRLQAMAIDFHFLVEQSVRSASGYFTNFTGTAGVWRREAIEDAGGWSARTLTEDLDLSYRAQLRGWKAAYVEDLVVPEELPVSIDAYRRQQSRWATGSFQSAFVLLGSVVRSKQRAAVKLQAIEHLLAYGVGPLMLIQLACYPLFLLGFSGQAYRPPWFIAVPSAVAMLVGTAPWIGFVVAQTKRGRRWWSGIPSLLCQVVGAGMSLNTILALFRAIRPGGVFVRTPKHHITAAGQEWRHQAYVRAGSAIAFVELVVAALALGIMLMALSSQQWLIAAYAAMFALGFLVVSGLSLAELCEVAALRGLGRRLSIASAPVPLFVAAALLLGLAAQLAEPFEDGYAHWLIAANLAATGHLRDPLFGMEDTWLPGYHVLAAAVLHVFGLWQLGALKLTSAALGLATAACVYRLAASKRQATIAVALLVLNPVFLFTSGSAVVEPLVTALLTAAGLAAVKRRMKLAALLAAIACATSTKAWLWVGAAVAFALLETLRSRGALRARVAWAVPAVAVLVFLQLGFAPASHSISRGTVEVMSATGRGSLPAGGWARLSELATTFGLATLPLLGMAAIGTGLALRRESVARWRFVYIPALAYLATVLGLVGLGVYTGSHRYLYPALPALALLAASALDRYGALVRVVVVGASGLLAVAFLPVFAGFGADNAGLIAAGRALATSPGAVVTDSPVVAYFSGKPPTEVVGSQRLPARRADAVAWMRAQDVTALALEDISYYRATSVFPDLVAGRASLPFVALGDESLYRAPGGKPIVAYRLLPALGLGPSAEGKTAPLAKGVTLGSSGTGEGMGFGVPIVRYPDGWVYSERSTTVQLSATSWRRTFELDTIGGDSPHAYRFVAIPSRGEIEVTYTIDAQGVAIAVEPLLMAPGYVEVGVLNEQAAAFDDFAASGSVSLTGSEFGNWIPVGGAWARLRSGSLGLEWSVPSIPGAGLFAGRELVPPQFNWAGLDYMFAGPFTGAEYRINVQEAQ